MTTKATAAAVEALYTKKHVSVASATTIDKATGKRLNPDERVLVADTLAGKNGQVTPAAKDVLEKTLTKKSESGYVAVQTAVGAAPGAVVAIVSRPVGGMIALAGAAINGIRAFLKRD